jgi:hypothetical protein
MTPKILYVDIENSPNQADVWGLWDQNVGLNQLRQSSRIIGVGYRWASQQRTTFLSIYEPGSGALLGNTAMLQQMRDLYDEADIVVTYNGNSFDNKHLNAAWAMADISPPSPYISIDLYRVVRQNFKFPSNKLDYVASVLLGDHKLQNTGHLLWRQCLDDDIDPETRRKAWSLMARYCRKDVDLLVPLHKKLTPWLPETVNVAVMGSQPQHNACPKCGSDDVQSRGHTYTRTRAYKRYLCKCCKGWFRGNTMQWGPAKA